jgi:hypothetical protein
MLSGAPLSWEEGDVGLSQQLTAVTASSADRTIRTTRMGWLHFRSPIAALGSTVSGDDEMKWKR